MALQPQTMALSFSQGIDTKSDPKQIIPGKLAVLENGRLTKTKQINKRPGNASFGNQVFGTNTAISNGAGTATFKNELLLMDGTELYSYTNSTNSWAPKGPLLNLKVTSSPVVRNTNAQTTADSAYHPSGLQVFTWEDSSGGSRYSVIDSVTNQAITQNALLSANAVSPKPLVLGNYILILYYDTTLTHLRFRTISIGTPGVLSAANDCKTDINTTHPLFDATTFNKNTYVTYNNNSGGISVVFFSPFLTLSSELQVGTDQASNAINIFSDGVSNLLIGYSTSTATKVFSVLGDLSGTVFTAQTLESIASRNMTGVVQNGTAQILYEKAGSTEYQNQIHLNTVTLSGTAGTASTLIRSVGLASKVFIQNNQIYVLTAYGPGPGSSNTQSLQPTYFLVNLLGQIAGKLSPGTAGGVTLKSILPEVNQSSSGVFQATFLQKDLLTTISGNVYSQTGVMQGNLDFVTGVLQSLELGSNAHFTGGFLSMYDGANCLEHGFHVFPEGVTVANSTTGGGMTTGSYEWMVVYRWTDNQGQDHISAPSVGVTVVFGAGVTAGQATITVPTLRLTGKQNVSVCIYRTIVNQNTFFRVTSITSPLLNNPAADTVTFTDTAADSVILGNEQLYTTGGVIENIAAPATQIIGSYKNRLILVPSESSLQWWFSQQVIPGQPVQMNDTFVKNVDSRGGNVTSVSQLGQVLILSKLTNHFYVQGDGPASNGSSDDITEASLISSDGGCVNAQSMVLMPSGLIYKGLKGIYLLTESGQNLYVGADVQTYNSNNVTSAQLIADSNQVRFTLDNGVCLVYDYYQDQQRGPQWSTDTGISAVDSTLFDNKFTWVNSVGTVFQETPGVFADNGQFYKLKAVTGPISFSGIQGLSRVWSIMLLGEYISPHNLLVQMAYDFSPVFTQSMYIPAGDLLQPTTYGSDPTYGGTSPYGGPYPTYQFKVDLTQSLCSAVQISIEDTQTSGAGESFSLSALTFEMGQMQGLNRIPASRTFSK